MSPIKSANLNCGSLLLASALPGTAIAQPARTPNRGGTMVMIGDPEPATLATYAVSAGNIPMITTQVFEGLLSYDWELNSTPALAKAWVVSPDGKTITFTLQEGVAFHNGEAFTSADVAYSFMEVAKRFNPNGPGILKELQTVETLDPMTAVFLLANPASYLMMSLSSNSMQVIRKKVFEGTVPLSTRPRAARSALAHSSLARGNVASSSGSTVTKITGSVAFRCSIGSSRSSFPTLLHARPRLRRGRRALRCLQRGQRG